MTDFRMPEGYPYYEIISRLGDLYVSYRKRFVLMMKGKPPFVPMCGRTGKYLPLSNRMLCGHLNQKFAVCVYAGACSSKFMCFDVDDGCRETVGKIMDALEAVGFDRGRIYVSTSGGKGYHVELFFDDLVYTDRLRVLYDHVCQTKGLDPRKVEFRPTAGQSIKLPLSVHQKTGNVCWFLDRDTFEPICTQEYLMEIRQFGHQEAVRLIAAIDTSQAAVVTVTEEEPARAIHDEERELICGDRYPDIRQEGERHGLMLQIAVHNRYRGLSPEACRDELTHWYRRQNKDLIKSGEAAVLSDIETMIRWAYSDRFQMVKRTTEIQFEPDDLRMLAAQPAQGRRKIMFYILLCMKKYGHATASAETMANLLGISRAGVIKALNQLQADSWITAKRNRCVTKPTGVIRLPNTYFLGDTAVGWAKGVPFTQMPGLERKREWLAKGIHFRSELVELDPKMEMDAETIMAAYAKVMRTAFDKGDLKKMMTAKEYENLEETENDE